MDINLIKKLIKIVEQSEITEFSVQEGDLKVSISKQNILPANFQIQPNYEQSKPQQAQPPLNSAVVSVSEDRPEKPADNLHEVRSPIVGTFYRAPAPDADVYVNVGDSVSTGSVLCLIEAMKLMNEIESDADGKIVKILVENASPVEYNQPLFLIQKN
jgi:acetyl-CoA carboxylase biotin carboxyl carrier protein